MKDKKRIGSIILLVVFTLFTLVSCGEKSLPEAKGFQWRVSKDGQEMYLVGTIHLTNPKYNYMNENIENMLKDSDGVAVEINLTDSNVINKAQEYTRLSNGETIEDYLNEEETTKLKAICDEINIKYEDFKLLKPSTILSNLELVAYILTGNNGEAVDSQLTKKINNDKKEVIELENVDDQYEIINELYTTDNLKEFLASIEAGKFVEGTKESQDAANGLSVAYIEGNDEFLESQVDETLKLGQKYYDIMLKNRNIEMVNNIEELFEKEGTHIVAVGAAHYFGEDGIVKLLENKGFVVERL